MLTQEGSGFFQTVDGLKRKFAWFKCDICGGQNIWDIQEAQCCGYAFVPYVKPPYERPVKVKKEKVVREPRPKVPRAEKICPCGNTHTDSGTKCGRCRRLWTAHKMTWEQLKEKLDSQGGQCPGCDTILTSDNMNIDHIHDQECCNHGKYQVSCHKCRRSILCQSCNTREGHYKTFFQLSPEKQEWWRLYSQNYVIMWTGE